MEGGCARRMNRFFETPTCQRDCTVRRTVDSGVTATLPGYTNGTSTKPCNTVLLFATILYMHTVLYDTISLHIVGRALCPTTPIMTGMHRFQMEVFFRWESNIDVFPRSIRFNPIVVRCGYRGRAVQPREKFCSCMLGGAGVS